MANLVIGTAGHVDHGKTTLIKALTGIETDTTKEEKKRGMSINLGFAYLDLPQKLRVGIVDVPGHEKFIKNMVAGLPGINLVLLVIDAGEGIMPQTREHLDILSLLGIHDFIIVLTKVDTVDQELREMVKEDIRSQLADSAAATAPLLETDAVSGTGLDALREKIVEFAVTAQAASDNGSARLNVDRVFSVKGFGTVVTGTLLDGSIANGSELYLYPGAKKLRVRNIQVHEQNVQCARVHQRTALNLANLAPEEIVRGDVLAASASLQATRMLDAKVKCLASAASPLCLWDRVRLLIGTREVMARVVPLGEEQIAPGSSGFIQLRLEQDELFVKARDRFILRSYSPMHTIAGGEVVDALPAKHRRFKSEVIDHLKAKDDGNERELLLACLTGQKDYFADLLALGEATQLERQLLQQLLAQLAADGELVQCNTDYLSNKNYKLLRGKAVQFLLDYHRRYPLRQGIPIEELRSRLRALLKDKYIPLLLERLVADGYCRVEKQHYAASSFQVAFSEPQRRLKDAILAQLAACGCTPLKKEDLTQGNKDASAVLEALEGKELLALDAEYVILAATYNRAVKLVQQYLQDKEKMTLGEFRDLSCSSRKNSMLILEYMDKQDITRRVENYRVLGTAPLLK